MRSHVATDSAVGVASVLGQFWTVANGLSLLRLTLAAPILWLIVADRHRSLLLVLVAVAVVSDWLDGALARWTQTSVGWGKVLDPLADKIAFAAGAFALAWTERIPWWFVVVVVVRDAVLMASTAVVLWRLRYVVPSNWLGKTSTLALAITLIAALLDADERLLAAGLWVSTPLLLVSAGWYLSNAFKVLRQRAGLRSAGVPTTDHRQKV